MSTSKYNKSENEYAVTEFLRLIAVDRIELSISIAAIAAAGKPGLSSSLLPAQQASMIVHEPFLRPPRTASINSLVIGKESVMISSSNLFATSIVLALCFSGAEPSVGQSSVKSPAGSGGGPGEKRLEFAQVKASANEISTDDKAGLANAFLSNRIQLRGNAVLDVGDSRFTADWIEIGFGNPIDPRLTGPVRMHGDVKVRNGWSERSAFRFC